MNATSFPLAGAGDAIGTRPRAVRLRMSPGARLAAAVMLSRAVILAVGAIAWSGMHRYIGWATLDPSRSTVHFGALGNYLAAPTVRWDSVHYLAIAAHGYTSAKLTTFFPVYPLLIRLLSGVVGSAAVAGVLISLCSFAAALVLLHRLTALELGERAANATILLLAFAPGSFFFSAVYTESLFLALSVGSFYAARRERWALAGALGAIAAATRVTGVLLAIPLAVMYLARHRRPGRALAWIAMVPAGLAAYMGFLALRGFGAMAPFAQESAYHRLSGGPVRMVILAVQWAASALGGIASGTDAVYQDGLTVSAQSVWLLVVLVGSLLALWAVRRRLPLAYGLYAAAALAVCLWTPFRDQPLVSFDRYAMTIFPLAMAAGAWLAERRLRWPVLAAAAAMLVICTSQFATWGFVG
jgi:hypothetical protein